MTINTLPENFPPDQYIASGGQVDFNVSYPFYANDDLTVYLTPVGQPANDISDILALNVDYTVSGASQESGGQVSLLTGATSGDIITIQRNTDVERVSSYNDGQAIDAGQLNQDLNAIVMMLQDQVSYLMRTVPQYQTSEVVPSLATVLPPLGQNQIWKGISGGGISASTVVENENCSTLRSDLAQNANSGVAGANLVGYFSSTSGATNVQDELDAINAASGRLQSILDFGGNNTGTSSNTGAFNDALTYFAANPNNSILYFPQGVYLFNTKPNDIGINLTILGQGEEVTQIVRNYSEGTATNGLFNYDNTESVQLIFNNFEIRAADSTTGGAPISFVSSATDLPLSPTCRNIKITTGTSANFAYGLVLFGEPNATPISNVNIENYYVATINTTVSDLEVSHVYTSNIATKCFNSIAIGGVSGSITKDCTFQNIGDSCTINFDYCENVNFYTPFASSVTNTSNSLNVNFYGRVPIGSAQINSGSFIYIAGVNFTSNPVSAITGNINTGIQDLPSRLSMKYGIVTVTGVVESAAVTFSSAFPTAVANVQITPRTEMPLGFNYYVDTPSSSGFTIRWREAGATGATSWSFMWTAWGY